MKISDVLVLIVLIISAIGFKLEYEDWSKDREPGLEFQCLSQLDWDCLTREPRLPPATRTRWEVALALAAGSERLEHNAMEIRANKYFSYWSRGDAGMDLQRFAALYSAVDQLTYLGKVDRAKKIKEDLSKKHLESVAPYLKKFSVNYLQRYELPERSGKALTCATEQERQALLADTSVTDYKLTEFGPNICLLRYFEQQTPAAVEAFVKRNAQELELDRLASRDDWENWGDNYFLMLLLLHTKEPSYRIY